MCQWRKQTIVPKRIVWGKAGVKDNVWVLAWVTERTQVPAPERGAGEELVFGCVDLRCPGNTHTEMSNVQWDLSFSFFYYVLLSSILYIISFWWCVQQFINVACNTQYFFFSHSFNCHSGYYNVHLWSFTFFPIYTFYCFYKFKSISPSFTLYMPLLPHIWLLHILCMLWGSYCVF